MLNLTAVSPAGSVRVSYQRTCAALGTSDLKLDSPSANCSILSCFALWPCSTEAHDRLQPSGSSAAGPVPLRCGEVLQKAHGITVLKG